MSGTLWGWISWGGSSRKEEKGTERGKKEHMYIHTLTKTSTYTCTVCLQLRSVYRLNTQQCTHVQHMQMYTLLVHRLNILSDTSLNTVQHPRESCTMLTNIICRIEYLWENVSQQNTHTDVQGTVSGLDTHPPCDREEHRWPLHQS